MIVKNAESIIGITLSGLKIEGDKVVLCMKNGSTLTLSPVFEDDGTGEFKDYSIDFVSKKENKKIDKLNDKMQALLNEINGIKANGLSDDSGTDADADADADADDEEGDESSSKE